MGYLVRRRRILHRPLACRQERKLAIFALHLYGTHHPQLSVSYREPGVEPLFCVLCTITDNVNQAMVLEGGLHGTFNSGCTADDSVKCHVRGYVHLIANPLGFVLYLWQLTEFGGHAWPTAVNVLPFAVLELS